MQAVQDADMFASIANANKKIEDLRRQHEDELSDIDEKSKLYYGNRN